MGNAILTIFYSFKLMSIFMCCLFQVCLLLYEVHKQSSFIWYSADYGFRWLSAAF